MIAHPLEYDETPEGRIAADAREIIKWMYERESKRNKGAIFPNIPDFRDFYAHLSPIIKVELLKAKLEAVEDALSDRLRAELAKAELELAIEFVKRRET